MENQSLIPSPNDNGGKQKNGYKSVQIVSTAILLLGLVFYGGEYWGRYRALGDGPTDGHLRHGEMGMTNAAAASSSSMSLVGSDTAASDLKTLTIVIDDDDVIDSLLSEWLPKEEDNAGGDVIPIDGDCYEAPEDCAIPPGLTHPNCICPSPRPELCFCASGQPGQPCVTTYNCVKPPGLKHPVCHSDYGIYMCQSGQPGSLCGVTDDCVVPPGLEHPVCRREDHNSYYYCQSGQPGSLCGVTDDCVVPPGLDHPVCRQDRCQR